MSNISTQPDDMFEFGRHVSDTSESIVSSWMFTKCLTIYKADNKDSDNMTDSVPI